MISDPAPIIRLMNMEKRAKAVFEAFRDRAEISLGLRAADLLMRIDARFRGVIGATVTRAH